MGPPIGGAGRIALSPLPNSRLFQDQSLDPPPNLSAPPRRRRAIGVGAIVISVAERLRRSRRNAATLFRRRFEFSAAFTGRKRAPPSGMRDSDRADADHATCRWRALSSAREPMPVRWRSQDIRRSRSGPRVHFRCRSSATHAAKAGYRVTIAADEAQRWAKLGADPSRCVEAAMRFLVDREPREAILERVRHRRRSALLSGVRRRVPRLPCPPRRQKAEQRLSGRPEHGGMPS